MRRFICAALAALYLTIPALAVETLPEESFSLSCTAAVLMERQTGTVLYEKEAHRHLSPASVTKVMTLLLVAEAVESGAVSPDDPVTASRRAASMGGSQIWLEEGEAMTVAEMTKCVAVVSANDCAVALAEALCGAEDAREAAYTGAGFEDEMLAMANFPAGMMNTFLGLFRRMGIAPVALKAMLTPTNAAWDSEKLHEELAGEHRAMTSGEGKRHQG